MNLDKLIELANGADELMLAQRQTIIALAEVAKAAKTVGDIIVSEAKTQEQIMIKSGVTTFKPEDAVTADELEMLKALKRLEELP